MITADDALIMTELSEREARIAVFCRKMNKTIRRSAEKGYRTAKWKGTYAKWKDLDQDLRVLYAGRGFKFRELTDPTNDCGVMLEICW